MVIDRDDAAMRMDLRLMGASPVVIGFIMLRITDRKINIKYYRDSHFRG